MKTPATMTENGTKDDHKFERYTPKNPLPDEIQKMERDETICKYCGVSYLIHNEIKALEEKLKVTEAELEKLRGCEERENKLKEDIEKLTEEKADIKRNLEAKEILITTLRNNLKSEEELVAENRKLQLKVETAMQLKEEYRAKHSLYQTNLPSIRTKLAEQRAELQNIHTFIQERDLKMKEEMKILLAGVNERSTQHESEKKELKDQLNELQKENSEMTLMLTALKDKSRSQEEEIKSLSHVNDTSTQLQTKVSHLESKLTDLQTQLEEAAEKHRQLTLENQQYKEQIRNKTKEMEDLTSNFRRKEQSSEASMKKLQSDLRQKEAELQSRMNELRDLEGRFQEQRRKEEEIHRKATLNVSESRELKQILQQAKAEIEQLKSEREVMITSHQNRIEQLRESFKQKLQDAESWPEKLQEALQKEKAKHAAALKSMEENLKDNFVMEMTIEKEKYQELLEKYQNVNRNHEALLKQQINSIDNRYKSEIKELQQILADSKLRAKETEDSLRKEVQNLKDIIRDLENRLARLDSGNDEVIVTLKQQLKDKNEELQNTKQEYVNKQKQMDTLKEELSFLQDTVRKECEERFELTEKLSAAREELLHFKRPTGKYYPSLRGWLTNSEVSQLFAKFYIINLLMHVCVGGYTSLNSSRGSTATSSSSQPKRSNSVPDSRVPELINGQTHSPQTNSDSPDSTSEGRRASLGPRPPKSPPKAPLREQTVTVSSNNSNISYKGEQAKPGGKMKGNSLEVTRKRIAAMLGRKT
ncbi:hypothetical protein FSP39_022556 [Pinctada imbricata]|uniref:Leucine-, glutamate- and lysine-rich protein 1 n=1 Tax=Pinctada imbricata TaxID=66713 RepID=A0AA89C479_PINIB|nr:hypothetical protein FSP39_022556 [Pinctada imbricata]